MPGSLLYMCARGVTASHIISEEGEEEETEKKGERRLAASSLSAAVMAEEEEEDAAVAATLLGVEGDESGLVPVAGPGCGVDNREAEVTEAW